MIICLQKHIKWEIVAVAVMVSLIGGCSGDDEPKHVPANRIYLQTDVQVTGGDYFTIDVYFENIVPVSAVSVPLKFPNRILDCDSVVYNGGRCEDFLFTPSFVSHDTIQIGAIDTLGVLEGDGLLARIYFWAHGNAPDTTITISLHINPTLPLAFADTSITAGLIVPAFEGGTIVVKTQVVP